MHSLDIFHGARAKEPAKSKPERTRRVTCLALKGCLQYFSEPALPRDGTAAITLCSTGLLRLSPEFFFAKETWPDTQWTTLASIIPGLTVIRSYIPKLSTLASTTASL